MFWEEEGEVGSGRMRTKIEKKWNKMSSQASIRESVMTETQC